MQSLTLTLGLAFAALSAEAAPAHMHSVYELKKDLKGIHDTLLEYCDKHRHKLHNWQFDGLERACGNHFNQVEIDGKRLVYSFVRDYANNQERHRYTLHIDLPNYLYFTSYDIVTSFADTTRNHNSATTSTHVEVCRHNKLFFANNTPRLECLTNGDAWRGQRAGGRSKTIYDAPSMAEYDANLDAALRQVRSAFLYIKRAFFNHRK